MNEAFKYHYSKLVLDELYQSGLLRLDEHIEAIKLIKEKYLGNKATISPDNVYICAHKSDVYGEDYKEENNDAKR